MSGDLQLVREESRSHLEESDVGRGVCMCKGPGVDTHVMYLRKSKEASMVGYGVGESAGGSKVIALTVRPLAFPLSNMKNL